MDEPAQADAIELTVIGPVQVRLGDRPVTAFRSRKALALLVYLAVTGVAQPRETLAGLLWPELPEDYARASLSQVLTNLRSLFASAIVATRASVALDHARLRLDLTAFTTILTPLTTAATARQPDLAALQTALAAYRGDFLAGLSLTDAPAFEEWATVQREQCRHLAVLGLHALAERQVSRGASPAAVEALRRLLTLEPWREEAHRQLMEVLAASGQRSAALAQYEQCRRALADELGAEPSTETTALYQRLRSAAGPTHQPPAHPATYAEWEDAPDPGRFYGRRTEAALLERWLLVDRCRVIVIVGLGGVGKTTLAASLTRSLAEHVDGVIWRSVLNAPPLSDLLREWLQVLARFEPASDRSPAPDLPVSLDRQLHGLVEGLRQRRWLLVLDNLESLLGSSGASETYRPGYADYGQLIAQLGRREHAGCLIITSRERPPELSQLEAAGLPVRVLDLAGLLDEAGRDILRERDLIGSASDETALVERYSGNPLALRLVAQTVQELFAGDIAAFLSEGTPIFDDIRAVLDQQTARLSPLELEIIRWLAIEREAVALQTLGDELVQLQARAAVLEAVRSLRRRSLVEQRGSGLTLQNVVTEYLTDRLIGTVVEELASARPDLLHRHALIKAEAKEHIRQSQVRLILDPVALRATARLGRDGLAATARRLLSEQRRTPEAPSYLAGNLLNLLLHLDSDLDGLDLSRLRVWQAYLRGVALPPINLANADLRGSTFSDDFRAITTMAFSPDGLQLAAGTNNGVVRCWRTTDWQPIHVNTGHAQALRSVAYSRDGRLLASAGSDGALRLWEAATGRLCQTLEAGRGQAMSVAFVPDGSVLISAYWDRAIIFWEVATGRPRHVLDGPIGIVESVAVSPDGQLLASGGWDGQIRLWDCAGGQLVRAWSAHERVIKMVAFSPDGQTLASGGWDATVCLWEVATGQLRQRLTEFRRPVAGLAFSPDGSQLACCGDERSLLVWDAKTGHPIHLLDGHTSWIGAIAFGADGTTLASGGWDQSIRLWDRRTGRPLQTLHGFSSRVADVAFSPDGTLLASAHHDRSVRLWQVESGRQEAVLDGNGDAVQHVAFSPDGSLLASAGNDLTIRLWETRTGRPVQVLRGHTNSVNEVSFSPAGTTLISAGKDGTIRLWSVATGQLQQTLHGHAGHVSTVAVSPDGRWLASAGNDPVIRLWDAATGQLVRQWPSDPRWTDSLRFSPDSRWLVSGGHDPAVHVYRVPTGEWQQTLSLAASVVSLAISPDGRLLAAGDSARLISIWELASGRLLHQLAGHDDAPQSLAFSPDGVLLASGSFDETLRLWEVGAGHCRRVLRVARPYSGMVITGISGVTAAQRAALIALGAVDQGATDGPAGVEGTAAGGSLLGSTDAPALRG